MGGVVYLARYLPKQVSFAALLTDGSVVTWGAPEDGGDSTAVQDQLHDILDIFGEAKLESGTFVAIRADGSLITWGRAEDGGDSSAIQNQLRDY